MKKHGYNKMQNMILILINTINYMNRALIFIITGKFIVASNYVFRFDNY
jgi:hypothetical protein